jgi:hypothetical protein
MSSQLNEEINNKIYQRFVPSHSLPPNLSVYPVPTKYVKLGITDNHPHQNTIQNNYQNFQCNTMFCPTLKNGNYNGYSNNIHLESELRNQFVALQKCDAAEYIPNYKSQLFHYSINYTDNKNIPFDYLFNNSIYMPFQTNVVTQNNSLFNNHTRQQNKEN